MFAVDTHVHGYAVFDAAGLVRAALRNACAAAKRNGTSFSAVLLCLTEGGDLGVFDRWRSAGALGAGVDALRLESTSEDAALRVAGLERPVFFIRGRQLVSVEGLEALAIGVAAPWPDRSATLADLLARIAAAGGYPIVPWGAGKWWGRRGATVRALLDRSDLRPFAFGDNGGRPWFWPRPRLLIEAEARGFPVLPGSDPLPFAKEESAAGRCLALARAEFDPARPAASLLDALRRGAVEAWVPAGRERALRFFRHQAALQIRKGKGRSA